MQTRFHAQLSEFPAAQWDALRKDDDPFLAHAFLAGLEEHGCIDPRYGWLAHHLGLYEGDRLVAAAPLYLKGNSHGEFIYDWAWADAAARGGIDYYPKLVCAAPYSPVSGARLLAGHGNDAPLRRAALVAAIEGEARHLHLSSAHVNFPDTLDGTALDDAGWLARNDLQFHWHRLGNWMDFDDFLAALTHKKRKNIRQERASVARAGITCTVHHGDELDQAQLRALHACYRATFEDKGNYATLTLDFFRHLARAMPRNLVAVLCRRAGRIVAGALMLRSATTLYGRYWGALEHVDGLHFEACYYQGIDYCLREGLTRFEPGAGGTHKIARGFLPVQVHSFHWIADAHLRAAIAAALRREAAALAAWHDEIRAHSPYARPDRASSP